MTFADYTNSKVIWICLFKNEILLENQLDQGKVARIDS